MLAASRPVEVTLKVACLQDAEDIARIHMDAFSQDDEFLMAFPSATCPRSAQHAWHIAQITSVLNYHNTEQSWKKIIKAIESNSGQMVGWAEWNMGVAPVDSEEDEEWPDGANIEACRQFFGGMSRLRLQFMGQQRHFYTHLLAVDSSWSRRGIATQLMKWGVQQADSAGLPAYIEATYESLPLYIRLGYEPIGNARNPMTADFVSDIPVLRRLAPASI